MGRSGAVVIFLPQNRRVLGLNLTLVTGYRPWASCSPLSCSALAILHPVNELKNVSNNAINYDYDVASAVGVSNCPNRESAAPSDYVELPTKEGKCQRFTASGDYSALRSEQYAQLEVYAALDVKTGKE